MKFVSDIINQSKRRLVIEDFHYLSDAERRAFAFDLKALWDMNTYVIVIGIWADNNFLLHLNKDLLSRIHEISIYWSDSDLLKVISKGSDALNIEISDDISKKMVSDSYNTVGILQTLALSFLDKHDFFEKSSLKTKFSDINRYNDAAKEYANQLNAVYQTFAQNITSGIRKRQNSTGIYAHMLAVVMGSTDDKLANGLSLGDIYDAAHAREARIQRGNLRLVLQNIDRLQVDEDGNGLIITYDNTKEEVFVVDKQLFFYRKYASAKWPWQSIISQINETKGGYDADSLM